MKPKNMVKQTDQETAGESDREMQMLQKEQTAYEEKKKSKGGKEASEDW